MGKSSDTKTVQLQIITNCKVLLFISKIKYPKYPAYTFPIVMLLKYIKILKTKITFKMKTIPQKLMLKLIKNNSLIDINNCIIVNKSYFQAILNSAEYVKIKLIENERLVQVLSGNVQEGEILASETLNFNFFSTTESIKIIAVDINNIKMATELDISVINSQYTLNNAVTDVILKNYLKNPKLLYKNDILTINLKEYAPEYYYTNTKLNEIDFVYFKCNKISCNDIVDCLGGYFCVIGETTLKQSADTQSYLPKSLNFVKFNIIENMVGYKSMVDRCPYGLQKYLQQLEKGVRPFTKNAKLRLNPTFLIQGSKGAGKNAILTALAQRFGVHLFKLSTTELSAQAYAQTEIKIKNAFFRAKLCSPCIVAINNFENFGKNNEGQYDPRIMNYFKTELANLFTNNEYPIILICVSNSKDIPSELGRLFLEIIAVDAPIEKERYEILKWILEKKSMSINVNINDVATKTHAFLFEDLEALVYYADKNRLFRQSDDSFVNDEDFAAALDVMQSNYTESLGAPKVPKVNWSDVGGLDDVKHEIIRTINLPLKHPELLKTTGLKRSGILLYGPPGTGKTLIAKAVATECGLCFLSVKGPELLNMYVGQSEQNVREIFEKARQASPCIIFFDELDSLAPNRGISGDSGGVMDRVVSQLLSEMDGLNQTATIFVIGATNRPDLIDPALLRPGRFDKLLYVGPCTDIISKIGVLKALTRKFILSDKVNLEKIVKTCPVNITGADFYGICSNAWMSAASKLVRKIETGKIKYSDELSHKSVIVTFKDFEEAIKNTKPSISREDLLYFDRLRQELSAKKP